LKKVSDTLKVELRRKENTLQ